MRSVGLILALGGLACVSLAYLLNIVTVGWPAPWITGLVIIVAVLISYVVVDLSRGNRADAAPDTSIVRQFVAGETITEPSLSAFRRRWRITHPDMPYPRRVRWQDVEQSSGRVLRSGKVSCEDESGERATM